MTINLLRLISVVMPEIQFFAKGIPKGQPRPRAFSMKGKIRVYDPGTAEGWKSEIANAGRPFAPEKPLEGPLFLGLEFYFPRPKSHYLKGSIRSSAPGYHTSRPDTDNVIKAVMDALTTLRFWQDDAQVCDVRARKLYDDGRGPGCIITIKELL